MDEPELPLSANELAVRLVSLRNARRERQAAQRRIQNRRKSLSAQERRTVLEKTDGRCHICGGFVQDRWEADHVLSYSGGGHDATANYLAAHSLCNNYRWDYTPEEFQWVLKIGVWARKRMEEKSRLGDEMRKRFFRYEVRRANRREGAPQFVAAIMENTEVPRSEPSKANKPPRTPFTALQGQYLAFI